MLTIRKDQMASLARHFDGSLRAAVAAHLRVVDPTRADALGDVKLSTLIDEAFASARGFGLQRQSDLTAFAALAFSLGPCFHHHPAVRSALSDPGEAPADRLGLLPFRVAGRFLRDAAALSSPRWWEG